VPKLSPEPGLEPSWLTTVSQQDVNDSPSNLNCAVSFPETKPIVRQVKLCVVDRVTLYVLLLKMVSPNPHFFVHQSLNNLLQHALSTIISLSPISIVLLGLACVNYELRVLHLPQALT
jgi:hypothetical protein